MANSSQQESNQIRDAECALIRALQQTGDDAGYRLLMTRYAPMVTASLSAIGVRISDRDDLLQETFTTAFLHLNVLRDPSRFGAWLLRIARAKLVDQVRKQRRNFPESPGDYTKHRIALERTVESRTPAMESARREAYTLVVEAIEAIPAQYRTILYMRLP